ncbi:PEP-CTERM sorting domain-containing protein [Rubritalea marina]|uniref:PEP-CTERM sorting domain-containing protein n=1 Tax=Rubritalea marina TaxID=361055 RepID=UPI0009FE9997|nr:PEP-CTERM sorting domain-containing protein [Rubritalea marina]
MKYSALATMACLCTSGITSAATYIWNGNANDQDWLNSGNWAGGSAPSSLSSPTGPDNFDTIIFDGSNMPTANIPSFSSDLSTNASNLQFNSGGSFALDLSSSFDDGPISKTSRTWLTVGDGLGLAGDVTVNINNASYLLRRYKDTTLNYQVNADGILNINSGLTLYGDNNKHVTFTLNGGSLISTGSVDERFDIGNNLTNSYFQFDAAGSSFTANYGGAYANFASLQADTNNNLRVGAGLALDFQDNGASFTVTATAVPEPSSLALVGLSTLTLLTRRRR